SARRRPSLVDRLPRARRDPLALAALAGDPHAGRVAGLRVEQHHVADVDRAFLLDHAANLAAALGVAQGARPLMALDDVGPLDVHALVLHVHAQHAAGPAFRFAGYDLHHVVFSNL